MAEEEQDQEVESGGGKKNLLIFIGALVLAVAGSVGGTFYFLTSDVEEPAEVVAPVTSNKPATAIYHNMRPPYIINYLTGKKPRYLQVEFSIMARNEPAIEAVITHMPLIRSRIINFLTERDFLELQTQEGKEQVRTGIVSLINEALTEQSIAPGIESVLITNFVLQ